VTTTFAISFATEGKIRVEDIVKLGSEIEDADTTNSIKLKSKNKTKEQEEEGT
jgi:hypothetical protein